LGVAYIHAGGAITLRFPWYQPVDAITLGTAFGIGQGVTDVTVQSFDSSANAWVPVLRTNLVWYSNTSLVEYRTIQLPSPISTSLRLVINNANVEWGHFALNQIFLDATSSLPPTVTSGYSTLNGQLSNLADGVPTTSWTANGSSLLPAGIGGFNAAWIGLQLPTATTVSTLAISSAYGQTTGITNVSVIVFNGSNVVSYLGNVPLTWNSNTSVVETQTINLLTPGPTTRVLVLVNSTSMGNSFSNFTINGLTLS
jgi:hypothetical protein